MNIPFTTGQFFQVIVNYNAAVFPMQLVIALAGFIAVWLLFSKVTSRSKLIGSFLSFIWIWTGIVYHLIFFTAINPAAYGFGALFIVQGLLMLRSAFLKGQFNFSIDPGYRTYTGYFLILYGLVIYPVVSFIAEGSLEKTIILGLPCPSTIMTFGLFILAARNFPRHLLIIPVIWAIIGTSAARNFGVFQDYMLIVSAVVGCILILSIKKEKQLAEKEVELV